MYKKILVPLDGSKNSIKALDTAIEMSKIFKAKIVVLFVVDDTKFGYETLPTEFYEGLDSNAKKVVEYSRDRARNQGLTINGVVEKGNPKQVIIDYAQKNSIDLIVIGKSGMNALNQLVIGSTTASIVRNANTQVLVVNA
ncbi:universal stress family protein [Lentilactobacillus buchneri ATCC 11577]|nr:universal stress family protein [Lentilactobacillus buchneri ATCC 11577]